MTYNALSEMLNCTQLNWACVKWCYVTVCCYLTCYALAGHAEGVIVQSKEGLYTDTVMLKWCTPKSTAVGSSSFCYCALW